MTKPLILVGALIEREGKFLLLQENHGDAKGLWNIPSGKLDVGEAPAAGATREAKEECGLDFVPAAILTITSMSREDPGRPVSHVLRIIYSGLASGELSFDGNEIDEAGDREISGHRWLTPEEVKVLPLRQPDIPAAIASYRAGQTLPLETVRHVQWQLPAH